MNKEILGKHWDIATETLQSESQNNNNKKIKNRGINAIRYYPTA